MAQVFGVGGEMVESESTFGEEVGPTLDGGVDAETVDSEVSGESVATVDVDDGDSDGARILRRVENNAVLDGGVGGVDGGVDGGSDVSVV